MAAVSEVCSHLRTKYEIGHSFDVGRYRYLRHKKTKNRFDTFDREFQSSHVQLSKNVFEFLKNLSQRKTIYSVFYLPTSMPALLFSSF